MMMKCRQTSMFLYDETQEMINAETIFHSFKMQYSLLYSSSIILHFSFYRMKLFQLEKKLYFFKVFLYKKTKWPPFQGHQGHTYQIYFFSLI